LATSATSTVNNDDVVLGALGESFDGATPCWYPSGPLGPVASVMAMWRGSAVALALVAQAMSFGQSFLSVAALVLGFDLVIGLTDEEDARRVMRVLPKRFGRYGLTLHPEKTKVVDMTEPKAGFDFLGYHFHHGGKRWPRKKSEQKLREKIRPLTKRTNGQSLATIIARLNPILRGWYGYFRHSRRGLLYTMDGWVRGRLRSILRKRAGKRGRGRGTDQQRWTNQYFACRGLFSLHEAQVTELQSHG